MTDQFTLTNTEYRDGVMFKALYKPIHSFVGDKTKPIGLEEYHGDYYVQIPFAELVATSIMPSKIEYQYHYQKWSQNKWGRWAAETQYLSMHTSINQEYFVGVN